ncbi:uncharacterized protein LOC143447167 isoform X1 [Clavelina lepadiformis]|uniref:uncharacterized protein LOC143447167 isoform X1 n=2 Tax=Clavelina lepadiformis TaxID=159417 RepID=UPI00404360F6
MELSSCNKLPPDKTWGTCTQKFGKFISKLNEKLDEKPKTHLREAIKSLLDTSDVDNSKTETCQQGRFLEKDTNTFLEDINGLYMVLDATSQICVHAELSLHQSLKKIQICGKRLDDFIHPQDICHFQSSINEAAILKDSNECDNDVKPSTFTSQFLLNPAKDDPIKETAISGVAHLDAKCFGLSTLAQAEENSSRNDFKQYFMCLAIFPKSMPPPLPLVVDVTTKGPPNQTITTRTEIPQPEGFYTRQDIKGAFTGIDTDNLGLQPSKCRRSCEMQELIKCCVKNFQEPRQNGNSLKQILLKQVLRQGQATSPAYKFLFRNGTYVTAQTKSKLMGPGQSGEPPFIMSIHTIYRDGTLQGLDLQGLPPSIRSILSGPVVMETPSTSCQAITTSSSSTFSPNKFLISSHYTVTRATTTAVYTSHTTSHSWLQNNNPRPCNSMEVARQLLASSGVKCNAETVNKVMSPPPHLNGHLVHAVGSLKSPAYLNELLTSVSSELFSSKSTQEPANISASTASLSDGSLSANYPGPPCIDISRLSKFNSLPTTMSTATQMVVNGITTMRKEAAVTTTMCSIAANDNDKKIDQNNNKVIDASNKLQGRVCTPPENSSLTYQPTSLRPRSASVNTSPPTDGVGLKRSSSTISQDSGIGEITAKSLRKPSKESKASSTEKKNKILTQLLSSHDMEENKTLMSTALRNLRSSPLKMHSPECSSNDNGLSAKRIKTEKVSQMPQTGPPVSAQSPMLVKSKAPYTLNLNRTAACSLPFNAASIYSQPTVPLSENFPLTDATSSTESSQASAVIRQRFSALTSVSLEESQELHEILENFSDIDESPSNQQTQQNQNYSDFQTQLSNSSLSGGHIAFNQPSIIDNMMAGSQTNLAMQQTNMQDPLTSPNFNQPQMMTSPLSNNIPSVLNPNRPMNLPASVTVEGPPYTKLVPTGQEMCPNMVVSTSGMMSPRMQQPQSSTPYRGELSTLESWEGKEPLVDLGTHPLPAGINPRMAIPVPQNSNKKYFTAAIMNGPNIMKTRPNIIAGGNTQNGVAFPNPQSRMMNSNQGQTLAQQPLNANGMMTPSASPGGFSQTRPSPTMNDPYRTLYNNTSNTETATNSNLRSPFLRQQQQQIQPVRNGLPGSNPQYPCNAQSVGSRIMSPKANDMMKARRTQEPLNDMQRVMTSPNSQHFYGSVGSPQLMPGQIPMNSFSPMKPSGFSPNPGIQMAEDTHAGSVNFYSAMRPTPTMLPKVNGQYNGVMGVYNNNNVSMMMPPNQQQITANNPNVSMTTPVAKTTSKRGKGRAKSRRNSKAKSTEDPPWVDMASPSGYNPGPLLQMTIGDRVQRPQATFKPSYNGVRAMTSSMNMGMTQQNQIGTTQTLNLNAFLSQHKQSRNAKQEFSLDSLASDSTNNVGMTPSSSLDWPQMDDFKTTIGNITSPNFSNGVMSEVPNLSSQSNSLALSGGGMQSPLSLENSNLFLPMDSAANDFALNTNVNNNVSSSVTHPCRYTGSVASASILSLNNSTTSSETVTSPEARRAAQRTKSIQKNSLLAELLTRKDP